MEQLSSFFQQLNRDTPSITGNIFGNNPPSTDNVTPDADETLSAASDLVAYTDQQPPTTTTISNLVTPIAPQPYHSSPPVLIPPTANQPPVASTSVPSTHTTYCQPTIITTSTITYQRSYRPGEFVDFASLLPKAMFSGGLEPEIRRLLTVQVASSGDDISI